jgi:hypothetical protein
VRAAVDTYLEFARSISDLLAEADGEPIVVQMPIKLDIGPEAHQHVMEELGTLRKRLGSSQPHRQS